MISVIIPTYNRAHLIAETLDSVLAQSYTDWECIIIDDHSDDHTDEIVDNYVKKDSRFRYFKKPKHLPKGPSASRNFGMTKSKGDYINWLDSDDLMHPEKMEVDLRLINSGDYDFTISQSKFFTDVGSLPKKEFWNKNLWSEDPINDFILKEIGWSTNAPLWSKKALEERGLSFELDLYTAEDFMYHLKALSIKLKPFVINENLIYQREHSQRLNNYNRKSPSKLKVYLYLINYKIELGLNEKTESRLYELVIRQFSNLLKKKDLETARLYKNKILKALPELYSKEIVRLYKYGKLFKLTTRFYSKLSPKINK